LLVQTKIDWCNKSESYKHRNIAGIRKTGIRKTGVRKTGIYEGKLTRTYLTKKGW